MYEFLFQEESIFFYEILDFSNPTPNPSFTLSENLGIKYMPEDPEM
jgi:hypothetical protein